MAVAALLAALSCPSAVAVHDDGNVLRYAVHVNLSLSHLYYMLYI